MTTTAFAQPAPRFPNVATDHEPPPGYTGLVFELSQDYPTAEPPAETMPWDSINFFALDGALAYARAVLDYGVEGNVGVDWVVQDNPVRTWYHAPWMHPGCGGREFVRGMTRERSSRPGELHPQQTRWVDNWAVGFYNPPGGHIVGSVWQDAEDPDASQATFPHGTVGLKLLFTTATVDDAPFLENSLEWTGNVYPLTGSNPCATNSGAMRENQTLRLLQIDIAVRDRRKDDTTGWVFGTFIYDGASQGATPFDRMQPVGLMWADDSDVTTDLNRPGVYINPDLADGFLNPDLIGPWDPNEPAKVRLVHAGLGGRLNGPVDNPISSCISCHARSGFPSQPVTPRGIRTPEQYTEEAFRQFFAEIPHGSATSTGADGSPYTRLDYSLQLAFGIRNFWAAQPAPAAAPLGIAVSRDDEETIPWEAVEAPAEAGQPAEVPAEGDEDGAGSSNVLYVAVGLLLVAILIFVALRARRT